MSEDEQRPEPSKAPYVHLRRAVPKRRPLRLLAPLVFAAIVALILYDRVPAVRTAVDRVVRPAEHQAREVCQQTALAAASEPRYARVVAPGEVHRTGGAYYVERVVIGEMGADGNESRFTYNCYVDPAGALIRGARGTPPASAPAASENPP